MRGWRASRHVRWSGTLRAWRTVVAGVALLATSLLAGARAHAQNTEFTLATGAVTFPTPTAANYSSWPPSATGPVTDSIAVPFEVSRSSSSWRIVSVLIRCVAVTGGKACGDIEWRNGPSGAWQALTLADAVVETRWLWFFGSPFGWTNTLWLRVRLQPNDPLPSVMGSQIALSLEVYRP